MPSLRSTAATLAPDDAAPRPTLSSLKPAEKHAPRRRLWFFAALPAVCLGVGLGSAVGRAGHVTSEVRSGSPGYRSTPSGKQMHWQKPAVTVYLDDSLKRLGPTGGDAVMQAFGQWVASDPRLPNLSFDTGKTSAEPKQDGLSTVSYAPIKLAGHERDVAITVTYSSDQTGEILEADVVLNALYPIGTLTAKLPQKDGAATEKKSERDDDEHAAKSMNDEAVDCQNRYDAQNVATHEAGHFFGLGEDMTERQATMFLRVDECETHKRVLSATDTQAITTLYAQNQDPVTTTGPGAKGCSFGASGADDPIWISGLLLGLSLARRRRPR